MPAPVAPRRWGLGDAVGGYVVAYFLAGLFGVAWVTLSGNSDDSLGLAVFSSLGLWIGMGGSVWVATYRKGSGDLAREMGFVLHVKDIPIGVAVGLACQFLLVPLLYLPFRLNDPNLGNRLEEPARKLNQLATGPGFVLLLFVVVVGAPLIEELFFRGLLLRSLGARFGPAWAVAGSAVAFGLAHYEPLQFLGLAAFGVVLAVLAWRTGRLGPSLVAHAVFNLATMVVLAQQR
jgi:membrane protease YdiL (CAAX protease family)